jgi:hypothetical protein
MTTSDRAKSGDEAMSSTTVYTIGTALRRAHDNDLAVSVLIGGQWIAGQIGGLDGEGLLLTSPDDTQATIRLGSISAVKVQAPVGTSADLHQARSLPSPDPLTDRYEAPDLPAQRVESVEPDWTARRDWGQGVALSVVAAAAE